MRRRRGPPARHPRVVVLAGESGFAAHLLSGLLGCGVRPVAVGLSAPDRSGQPPGSLWPVVTAGAAGPVSRVAADARVTLEHVAPAEAGLLRRWLASLGPEFIVLACYPRRLPAEVAALARSACVNLHPSLLPRHRGPWPLLAQLRAGERETGVTVHQVSPGLDAGPVLLQLPVPLDDGIDLAGAERLLASTGASLLAAVVRWWGTGRIRPRAQDPRGATWAAYAQHATELSAQWPARRAFNYVLATPRWRGRHHLHVAGRTLRLDAVTGFDPVRRLGAPLRRHGDELEVQFSPGVLRVRARELPAGPGSRANAAPGGPGPGRAAIR